MGRPRYEIQGNKSEEELKTPTVNVVKEFITSDNETVNYRIISPDTLSKHMSRDIVLILDEDGLVASGNYSPTVKALYDKGVPVAILPLDKSKPGKVAKRNLELDAIDISIELVVDKKVASRVIVLANDSLAKSAIHAMNDKRSKIERTVLINPTNSVFSDLKQKTARKISTAYFNVNEEDIENPSNFVVFDDDSDYDKQVDSFITRYLA